MAPLRNILSHLKNVFISRIAWQFRRSDFGPKIFVIGYNKTGTTSVGKAIASLGYSHSSFNRYVWRKLYLQGRVEEVIRFTSKFEAFDDLPWLRTDMIPILDERFPGSKFIYLSRDEASWKRSWNRWNKVVFGKVVDADDGWETYCEHEAFVSSYFHDSPADRYLAIAVADPMAFRKITEFLNAPYQGESLPHLNQTPTT